MDLPGPGFDSNDPFLGEMRIAFTNSTASGLNLSPRAKLILEVLMVLMCVGAVTGNILVIVIVAATKTFHSVTSVLIINLAISDFLVGIGVMPFLAVSIMDSGWVTCTDLCLYVGYTSSVYCTASVLTLAAIALDRYHSIIDCLRYDSCCTMRRTGVAVLWIWLQALVTSCPPLLGWSSVSYVGPMYSCAVNWASSPSYTAFMAALSFLVPAVVILFCYVRIVRVARGHARRIHSLEEHLQRCRARPGPPSPAAEPADAHAPSGLVYYLSGRFVPEAHADGSRPGPEPPDPAAGSLPSFLNQPQPSGQASQQQQQQQQQQHGIVRLFLVISAFFLCWTPYMGVALVQAAETALARPASVVPPSAVTFSYWLVLLNSDINPVLYALLSRRFQGALLSLRRKLQAWLGRAVGRGGEQRPEDFNPRTQPAPAVASQPASDGAPAEGTTYSSVFTLNSTFPRLGEVLLPGSAAPAPPCPLWQHYGEGGPKGLECLQVPSRPQEGDRLPCSAATKERQATFFYGQITVRVEHDVG